MDDLSICSSFVIHFSEVIEPVRNSEITAAGKLLPVKYIAPSEPDLGGVNPRSLTIDELGRKVEECTVAGDILSAQPSRKFSSTDSVFH